MIALLRGRVVTAALDGVVLDVGGVGYDVRIPPGSVTGAPGTELTLHTHLAVREDALTLYGFPDPAGRALFETLLTVGGIGPKVALAALGTLGGQGLRRAIVAEDVDALTVVPGIARKGAQRIILELRGKLVVSPDGGAAVAAAGAGGGASVRGEVAQALAALGYAPAEAQRALDRAAPGIDDGKTAEELLREVLRLMGSG